jgi:hypothetical protein
MDDFVVLLLAKVGMNRRLIHPIMLILMNSLFMVAT